MIKPEYLGLLLVAAFIVTLNVLHSRLKSGQNIFLDGILSILCAGALIRTLFVRYPAFVSLSAVVLRLIPALSGLWMLVIARRFDPSDREMEYRARALEEGSLVAGFFFASSVWAQWGILLIGAPSLYLLHHALGIPDYSGERMPENSLRGAARLMGHKRGPDGKYDDPELQERFDKLEEKSGKTDEKKD
ncbi:MAG: hypothetical protein JXA21_10875 [Anaerolineae bacterium]|nr:hypothetical protein [Anaerolineae bacterium]